MSDATPDLRGPYYAEIEVELPARPGDVSVALARVRRALIDGYVDRGEVEAFDAEVAGVYRQALKVAGRWVRLSTTEHAGSTPHYPQAVVALSEDGQPVSDNLLLGRACDALVQQAGISPAELGAFLDEAISHDYDHLIDTVRQWLTITD